MPKFASKASGISIDPTPVDKNSGQPTATKSAWRKNPLFSEHAATHAMAMLHASGHQALRGWSTIKDLHHSDVQSPQKAVSTSHIKKYAKGGDPRFPPVVVKSQGVHHLVDGNHRFVADALHGRSTKAAVVDHDAMQAAVKPLIAKYGVQPPGPGQPGNMHLLDDGRMIDAASHIRDNPGHKLSDFTRKEALALNHPQVHDAISKLDGAKTQRELQGVSLHPDMAKPSTYDHSAPSTHVARHRHALSKELPE